MKFHQQLVLLFTFVFCKLVLSDSDVEFVAIIYRHGDRNPIELYPTDPWRNESYWPEGLSELTKKGKQRHYELGKYFRKRYQHLLSDKFKSDEIYVKSTDTDRTLMSAVINLAGMYPTNETLEWESGLPWQPLPVHSCPLELDDILSMGAPCPRYDMEMQRLLASKTYTDMDKEYQEVYRYVSKNTKKKVDTLEHVEYIYNVLKIEEEHGYTLPNWTKNVYPDKLYAIAIKSFLTQTYTSLMAHLRAGPLIKDILKRMLIVANGKETPRVAIYSAHDDTVANVLNAMGLFKPHLPEYASNILIELVKPVKEGSEPSVRVLYQKAVMPTPLCGELCPLSRWENIYAHLIPHDWKAECDDIDHWNAMLERGLFAVQLSVGILSFFLTVLILFGIYNLYRVFCVRPYFIHFGPGMQRH